MAQGKKTGGRQPGTPNKATIDARFAIGTFIDGNIERLQGWLDAIATGVTQNTMGEEILLKDGPNPEKAFSLFQSVIEYHVPKLARTELTGKDGGAMQIAWPLPKSKLDE